MVGVRILTTPRKALRQSLSQSFVRLEQFITRGPAESIINAQAEAAQRAASIRLLSGRQRGILSHTVWTARGGAASFTVNDCTGRLG